LITKNPEDILYNSQVDAIRDNDDEGTADSNISGFRDYCISEITLRICTKEFKSTYLALLDDILSYDILDKLVFVRNLLLSFSSKYEISLSTIYFVLGQRLEISVISEEDVSNILKFIEFIEYDCCDFISETIFPYVEDINNLDPEQIINNGGIDFLKYFLASVRKNEKDLPKIFSSLVFNLSEDRLRVLIIKMLSNNIDNVFIKIKEKAISKIAR
jgi:hypothetical protein